MTNFRRWCYIFLGPLLFLLAYYGMPLSWFGSYKANGAIGTILWMSFWWVTCPVDLAVTAFLPIVLNAIFQMANMNAVIANYSSETILLLLGASILTVSWEETGLDKRIATWLLSFVGSNLRVQVALWFIMSALLSSILPNAVVCASIIPIAIAMLKYVGEADIGASNKASLLLLTIVYAAGVGGLATPLGGAMNLVTVKYIEEITGNEYMYTEWVMKFLPLMLFLIVSNAVFLVLQCNKDETLGGSRQFFIREYKKLPMMSLVEIAVLLLFIFATSLSFSRPLYAAFLPGLKPAYVFILCAIISFLITHKGGIRLLNWKKTQQKIVWELIYVFAGGLAVGCLINQSGAAIAIGKHMSSLNADSDLVMVFAILLFTILMSDITSNTATAAVAIPIVIAVSKGMNKDPIPFIYVASIGINLSYMLPTSIRAIPVGYGMKPSYMLKKGIPLTVSMILSLSLMSYYLLV